MAGTSAGAKKGWANRKGSGIHVKTKEGKEWKNLIRKGVKKLLAKQ